MAVIPIYTYPDPVLAKKCEDVVEINDELITLAHDMVDTMFEAPGIGLAAPQVGRSIRLIVVDLNPGEDAAEAACLFNPTIVSKEGSSCIEEGCLSVPDYAVEVPRAAKVVVEALNEEGKKIRLEAEGMLATCLQHEIDHLEGTVIIDYVSSLKRSLYKKRRLKKMKKGDA
ncbi:peptide deformylase [Dethiosulfatarculus sandiegensis]|uniref:Peptide deformylase n=1 Tax=Dethiosulfatarculus sandiegensis TaxID=1429043 RepID=A0A0D2GLL0_9BACT|nr:peptide deformylase [Dethiosulfatarculus sandiegensis]KIX15532.1 peptide deformylase [Dethiosulfatarculus sandiegensis]